MAYFHTTVLDNQIKALPTVGEASGSVASFDTDMTEDLIEVICDIPDTGASEVNLVRCEKNFVSDIITGYIVGSNGVVTSSGNVNSIAIAPVKSGKTYTITTDDSTGFVGGFFTNKPIIGSTTYNGSRIISINKTFTAPIDGWVAFRTSYAYSTPQCELGNEATTFEPYNSNTYTVNFGSTILGGTVDIITGKIIDGSDVVSYAQNTVEIPTINGKNNIVADTGDTEVKYVLSVGKAIS